VDDVALITTGKDFSETHQKICNIMNHAGGIFEWAALYNCEFGIEKIQLLDITMKLVPNLVNPRKKIPTPQ
jgi:hypothetical protein